MIIHAYISKISCQYYVHAPNNIQIIVINSLCRATVGISVRRHGGKLIFNIIVIQNINNKSTKYAASITLRVQYIYIYIYIYTHKTYRVIRNDCWGFNNLP